MMDLSDGISKDARTLCFENRLGLELSLDGLKVPNNMMALSLELNIPWQEWVLHGGEEYELLFAALKSFRPESLPAKKGKGMVRLGVFTDEHKDLVVREEGRTKKIPKKAWDHIFRYIY